MENQLCPVHEQGNNPALLKSDTPAARPGCSSDELAVAAGG